MAKKLYYWPHKATWDTEATWLCAPLIDEAGLEFQPGADMLWVIRQLETAYQRIYNEPLPEEERNEIVGAWVVPEVMWDIVAAHGMVDVLTQDAADALNEALQRNAAALALFHIGVCAPGEQSE